MKKNLDNFEAGNVASWVDLASNVRLEPTSTHYPYDPLLDLTQAPGWNAADGATQERIVKAAARYAEAGDPQNEEWTGTSAIFGTAIAGFQALVLLLVRDEERLDRLGPESWAKWAPVLIRYPFGDTHGVDFQGRLLKRAYKIVPGEVIGRILQAIDFENERSGRLFQTREIEFCWDERMEKALISKLADSKLKPNVFATILDLLWSHGVAATREIAEAAVDKSFLTDDSRRSRMMSAAHILMKHAPDGGWPLLWPLIHGDADFGEELIESVSFPDGGKVTIVPKLTEAQLGELYVWLVERYPYAEHRSSFGAMGPGDTAVFFRDGVLEHLKRRGTFAACDALRKVMDKFPAYAWLAQPLEEAEWLARAATWQPVSIPQLLALASNRDKRVVETAADLMEIVLESLERLDATFRGELPAAKFLWNESNKTFRPKGEEDFSDYVARHLREDLNQRGIVVNREVQIRKGIGGRSGQLTDILVDATIPGAEPGSYEPISVVIESKGNWHPELSTAMETQLRDRYLKDRHSREGVYLVGWFDPAKWDDADGRKRQVPQMSLPEAKKAFTVQAEKLSTDCYSIRSYVLDIPLA